MTVQDEIVQEVQSKNKAKKREREKVQNHLMVPNDEDTKHPCGNHPKTEKPRIKLVRSVSKATNSQQIPNYSQIRLTIKSGKLQPRTVRTSCNSNIQIQG